jgi:hypothetical protein
MENLDALKEEVCIGSHNLHPYEDSDMLGYFENIDGADVDHMDANPPAGTDNGLDEPAIIPPEERVLSMPSTSLPHGHLYCALELQQRKELANQHLSALRAAIADKSFQYSHVMRAAPRKSVTTRSRKQISMLNNEIASYCRAYTRCRSAIVRLGADAATLQQFQVLVKDDLKSSTAILDPNRPGSTTLRLSWIWQGHNPSNGDSDSLLECEHTSFMTFMDL